jgi:hypothetical protein
MSQTLLQVAFNLLLSTAAHVAQPAAPQVQAEFPMPAERAAPTLTHAATTTQRPLRGARVSLLDPYYSFSRARRAAVKD